MLFTSSASFMSSSPGPHTHTDLLLAVFVSLWAQTSTEHLMQHSSLQNVDSVSNWNYKWWSHHQTTPFPPYFVVEQCRLTSLHFLCISQNLWFLTDQSQISTGLMFILCGPCALLLLFPFFVSHIEDKKKKTLNAKVSKDWSETAAETCFQAKYV